MENKKFNAMGNEVAEGFVCKPKDFDPNRPLMRFKTQIFICDGERCAKACKGGETADFLRGILKDLNLHAGSKRIKISRANCFGACRFRRVAVIFENTRTNGFLPNNNIWLKNVHKYDEDKWRALFLSLSSNETPCESNYERAPTEEGGDENDLR